MALLASNAGPLYGLVARVLSSAAPLNYAEMAESLSSDADALSRAAAQVWLFGDDQTVKLTNAVVLAAADVVTAHTAQAGRRLTTVLNVAVFGWLPYDGEGVARAQQALAKTRRALTDHTRQALKLKPVDVFGLPVPPPG
ncbi:hypothetical protein [Segeticoccus rhizosphaerae]|uniref:hypothetical protein n=1 Tax=Segeticoccus rhizosphaerae TaxID=1104777 RepID=UPI00126439D8|nr:hypothetical protein [Segeticoccus rhizosphaerae]